MTTDEILQVIFSDKESYEKIRINYNTWRTIKKRFRDKKLLSIELKEYIISKYGGILIQDKQWILPGNKDHQK